ncbi:hypothetical protein R3W88_033507 [Solanum pinnatisectum]|uniref:Uncharacterized protein n=1 Tax=Solanum pinnatisectum TaxID=50273 RepID=A0AAV9K0U6_9SOLN|nr:hypothetical protein R3W88_033507 [Solanum pinnatisectum]
MNVLVITLWVLLFSILKNTKFVICVGICRENEQRALEILKIEVDDPSDIPSSWVVEKDCCEREGVVCNNLTCRVIELHINYLRIDNLEWLPTLLSLEKLEMYHVINMLPSLVDLSLSNCSLHNITNLLHHNFSSLETLYLSRTKFDSPIPKWVFNLGNLVSLNLSDCNFTGPFPDYPVNLTSLTTLKAFENSFNCLLPEWLFDLSNLEHLNLRSSGIKGAIPNKSGNITTLKYLDLSDNNLNSTIPNCLYQCKDLESLYISENRLERVVSSLISNLSSITNIYLHGNMLSRKLPNVIGILGKLEFLSLSKNQFEGQVSELFKGRSIFFSRGLGNTSSLMDLRLHGNKLTGTLPKSLGQLPMLEYFFISNNKLEGVVTESHFSKLAQLQLFSASRNNLTLKEMIMNVDISDGGIQGEVPTWFWNLSSQIVPVFSTASWLVGLGGPWLMYLGSNNFRGSLLRISTSINELDLSNNLFSKFYPTSCILNLNRNNLSEKIPNCWMNWSKSMDILNSLLSLDLQRNRVNGPFPSSLKNCTKLHKIDFVENEIVGGLPSWLGMRFLTLIVFILRSNKFNGELPQELCRLKDLQILDPTNNTFVGIIPRCIGNFSAMVKGKKEVEDDDELNYSYFFGVLRESAIETNKGNKYQYDTILAFNFSNNNLTVLESIDLSKNQFLGQIPQSFSSLSTLSFLNLFDDNSSGMIPLSTQLQSFDLTSFQGNKLCGLPLLMICNLDDNILNHEYEDDENDKEEGDWFYISMAIGFALSFWGVCGSLLFKRSWRHAYFHFLDRSWEMLLAKIPIW